MSSSIFAWETPSSVLQRHANYMAALMLNAGDVVNVESATPAILWNVQCSTHLVGAAPAAAFSMRSLGNYACTAGTNVFASATTVTELYNSGSYANGVYTAEQTGAYHFNYFARFQDGASRTPGVYVQVNGVVWQNNPTDSGVVSAYDDGQATARHYLPYSFDIPLNQGDQVQIMAATTDVVLYQDFSGYFVGFIDVPRTCCIYSVWCVFVTMGWARLLP